MTSLRIAAARAGSDLGEVASLVGYGIGRACVAVARLVLFLIAAVGLVLTAVGGSLLWVVTISGGVRLKPVTLRWPVPASVLEPPAEPEG